MTKEDRRRYTRYHADVSLSVLMRFPSRGEVSAQLRDISIDGLSFATREDITKETFVTVSLEIVRGGQEGTEVEMPAKIVWEIYDKESSLHIAGVQFVGLSGTNRQALQDILNLLTPREGL